MKQSKDFFWPSYVDLMTALFLTMLVLFVLSYKLFRDEKDKLIEERDKYQAAAAQLALIQRIERSLDEMMADKTLFKYDSLYRRYSLAQQVQFQVGKWDLSQPEVSLIDQSDVQYLRQAGGKLRYIVDQLLIKQQTDTSLQDVSYVLAIVGNASNLNEKAKNLYNRDCYTSPEDENYILSYQRAKALYEFWRNQGVVDFNDKKYHDVIELIIAGNGWGGVGRINENQPFNYSEEQKNQRFLIQIIPKVGKVISQTP